jgi:hypothetical protein
MRRLGYLLIAIALFGASTGAIAQRAPQTATAKPHERTLVIPDYDLGTMKSMAVLQGKCGPDSEMTVKGRARPVRFTCRDAVFLLHQPSAGGDTTILVYDGPHDDRTLAVTGVLGTDDTIRLRYAFPTPGLQVAASGACQIRRGPGQTGLTINEQADSRASEWAGVTCAVQDAESGLPLFRFRFDADTEADRRGPQILANAGGKGRRDDINYAPVSCATGTIPPYPPFGPAGLVEAYRFESEQEPADLQSLMRAIENDHAFVTYAIDSSGQTRLTMHPSDRVMVPEQVDAHLHRLCAIVAPQGFRITHLSLRQPEEERRLERARWLEERAFHHQYAMGLPGQATVEALLRAEWLTRYQYEFGLSGARFGRVRDLACRYTEVAADPFEDHITCTAGVLATSARGPEYEQRDTDFTRGLNRDDRHEILLPYDGPLPVIN